MEDPLPFSVEPNQRGELKMKFSAGEGTFTQTVTLFVEANNALYQRKIDVSGIAHKKSAPAENDAAK